MEAYNTKNLNFNEDVSQNKKPEDMVMYFGILNISEATNCSVVLPKCTVIIKVHKYQILTRTYSVER